MASAILHSPDQSPAGTVLGMHWLHHLQETLLKILREALLVPPEVLLQDVALEEILLVGDLHKYS